MGSSIPTKLKAQIIVAMKINICEVCAYRSNKIVRGDYRVGIKGGDKVDLCSEHMEYFDECKTGESFNKKVMDLFLEQKKFGKDFVLA